MIYPIDPCPKPRMTQRDRWKKRPCVLRYRRFKDQVRLRRVKLPKLCHIVFWMPMPRTWSLVERCRKQGTPHQQRPDLDNLTKALWDAVHTEDAALWQLSAEKRWGHEGRIEVQELDGLTCRVCGCTDDDCSQCVEKTGEPCCWIEPGLCSACVSRKVGQP